MPSGQHLQQRRHLGGSTPLHAGQGFERQAREAAVFSACSGCSAGACEEVPGLHGLAHCAAGRLPLPGGCMGAGSSEGGGSTGPVGQHPGVHLRHRAGMESQPPRSKSALRHRVSGPRAVTQIKVMHRGRMEWNHNGRNRMGLASFGRQLSAHHRSKRVVSAAGKPGTTMNCAAGCAARPTRPPSHHQVGRQAQRVRPAGPSATPPEASRARALQPATARRIGHHHPPARSLSGHAEPNRAPGPGSRRPPGAAAIA